ncbi:MAG: hypothetical protein LBK52_07800 [Deltaproteobacteria bacterium]|jgi:hypothetical protein|nr:hypothetical protein [Deltaproteobacteria bacterium]
MIAWLRFLPAVRGLAAVFFLLAAASSLAAAGPASDRQHIVYFEGTPQELEIYKIYGQKEGPTIMIMGGIQGDEPGGFLSADLYVDLSLQRGNLIVVPRANFRSIITYDRGLEGDMNRKFDQIRDLDPDRGIVEIIKNLMAESDLFLNLHDGSGFFRPIWESDMANPSRYGQCIIADAEVYTHPATGRVIHLGQEARKAVELINREISEEKYKFSFSNHDTLSDTSAHKEQRKSASYYALTKLGIPAYGLETSKQLPSLEMKVRQHNLAVNAFMELYGVIPEQPRVNLAPPALNYLIISVNGQLPVAVSDGQTLLVAPGDKVEVIHVGANYDRGLSADIQGLGSLNDIRMPLAIRKPTAVIARRDNSAFGQIKIDLLPKGAPSPQLLKAGRPVQAQAGYLTEDIPGARPDRPGPASPPETGPAGPPPKPEEASVPAGDHFVLEVNGRTAYLVPEATLTVAKGDKVRLVQVSSPRNLPSGTVMNLKGFVGRPGDVTGSDQGTICDTGRDMISRFALEGPRFPTYQLGAEDGPRILFKAYLEIREPVLKEVAVVAEGRKKVLKLGQRLTVKAGSPVTVQSVTLEGDLPLAKPRLTLGGRPFSASLPQEVTMPPIAVSLAVFTDGVLAGKVVLVPRN